MDDHPTSGTLALSIYIITFLIGVPTNILAFCTFYRKVRRKPAPIDILLLNITISDLIFLTFLPFKMKEAADGMIWNMPYFLCPLSNFVFYAPFYNSILFLTAVSVDRYVCVAFPMKYKGQRRINYTVVASVAFWIVALAHWPLVFVVKLSHDTNHTMDNDTHHHCFNAFTPAQLRIVLPVRLEFFLVLFLVPLLICCFCYINFIRILSRLPHISRKRKLRAIGLVLGTLLVFAICFGPHNVSHVVGFIKGSSPKWRTEATMFSTFNACLDPIIFYCTSWEMRRVLKSCFKGFMDRLGLSVSSKQNYMG